MWSAPASTPPCAGGAGRGSTRFPSLFGEYLVGHRLQYLGEPLVVPDNYLLRNLTGVIFPGPAGDLQLFTSLSVGHGKGLHVLRKEFLWGGGVRVAFF
jgi:hypothetical protein